MAHPQDEEMIVAALNWLLQGLLLILQLYLFCAAAVLLRLLLAMVFGFDRYDLRYGLGAAALNLIFNSLLWPLLLITEPGRTILINPINQLRDNDYFCPRSWVVYRLNNGLLPCPPVVEVNLHQRSTQLEKCMARIDAHELHEHFRQQIRGTDGRTLAEFGYKWTTNIDEAMPSDKANPELVSWQLLYAGQSLALNNKASLYCKKCGEWSPAGSLRITEMTDSRLHGWTSVCCPEKHHLYMHSPGAEIRTSGRMRNKTFREVERKR